jgi:GH25 family lysozyme M1 (1,4-beta-N-acetylmuramidase)/peptidoglycan hydrolase-like protein with peptidoglycan-binding domain
MHARQSQDAEGIDVSHWQGTIDWKQVAASGVSFAYIKATESGTYVDPQYTTNIKAAHTVGILRGAYHFARPGDSYSAQTQADHFVQQATVNGTLGELPPALDLEDAGRLSKDKLTAWVQSFVYRVQTKAGRRMVLYVSPVFAQASLNASLSDIPLWVADWGVSEPPNFDGWTQWMFWQYTNQGHVSGVGGPVDRNVYAGSATALRSAESSASGGHVSVSPSKPTPQSHSAPQGNAQASEPMLSDGATGNPVTKLQILLYHAGQNPGPVNGHFGPQTSASVKALQQARGIASDGIVGPVTWKQLNRAGFAARQQIAYGSVGTEVKAAQYLLEYHGAKPGPADGIFGENAEAATNRFQTKNHLSVDGIIGPQTWSHLTKA